MRRTLSMKKNYPEEYIKRDAEDQDWLICVCGNTPEPDGFFSCDAVGNFVEPTPENYRYLCCSSCNRIFEV